MKNTFGSRITLTLFGESRKEAVGCIIDGIAPGTRIDREAMLRDLEKRAAYGEISTARHEADEVRILSGVHDGRAEGTPIAILIGNGDVKSDGSAHERVPRPGHADYAQLSRYDGYCDLAGGGHASGRLTAPLVAAGAIFRTMLSDYGIAIGTHIKSLHGVCDRPFGDYKKDIFLLNVKNFPALSDEAEAAMKAEILSAKEAGDSVGGILEVAVTGVPAGVGEPWFDALESTLAHALFAIPGVKGVSFGDGFGFAGLLGSEANDALVAEGGKIRQKTNRNGGISGGISTGAPILIEVAVRPTPTIAKPQSTLDLQTGKETTLAGNGRNDPAIIHRARAAVDAAVAHVIADALAVRRADLGQSGIGG